MNAKLTLEAFIEECLDAVLKRHRENNIRRKNGKALSRQWARKEPYEANNKEFLERVEKNSQERQKERLIAVNNVSQKRRGATAMYKTRLESRGKK